MCVIPNPKYVTELMMWLTLGVTPGVVSHWPCVVGGRVLAVSCPIKIVIS